MSWLPFLVFPRPASSPIVDRLRRRSRRRKAWWAGFTLVTLLTAVVARATTVVPPTFPELVEEAETIVRAKVESIESRWVETPTDRAIKTFVRLSVLKRIKGNPADTINLEFLGGTVGGETLRVIGMPAFKTGETEIVFIHGNGVQFCPLVRLGHGRYRVRTDAATRRAYVSRDDDTPLGNISDVQLPADSHGIGRMFRESAGALTPEDFEAEISREMNRRAR